MSDQASTSTSASTSASEHDELPPSPSTSASGAKPMDKSDWRAILEHIDWNEIFGNRLAADEVMAKRPKIPANFANRKVIITCKSAVDDKEILRTTIPYTHIAWSKMIRDMFINIPPTSEMDIPDNPLEVPILYDPATCAWTPKGIAIALKYCDARELHADEPIRKYEDRTFREIRPNYEGWEHKFMVDMGLTNLIIGQPLYELFMSAQFLNMRDLIQLTANTLAFDYLIVRTTEQLRTFFGVTDDMTPEEHAAIDEEFTYIDM